MILVSWSLFDSAGNQILPWSDWTAAYSYFAAMRAAKMNVELRRTGRWAE